MHFKRISLINEEEQLHSQMLFSDILYYSTFPILRICTGPREEKYVFCLQNKLYAV